MPENATRCQCGFHWTVHLPNPVAQTSWSVRIASPPLPIPKKVFLQGLEDARKGKVRPARELDSDCEATHGSLTVRAERVLALLDRRGKAGDSDAALHWFHRCKEAILNLE